MLTTCCGCISHSCWDQSTSSFLGFPAFCCCCLRLCNVCRETRGFDEAVYTSIPLKVWMKGATVPPSNRSFFLSLPPSAWRQPNFVLIRSLLFFFSCFFLFFFFFWHGPARLSPPWLFSYCTEVVLCCRMLFVATQACCNRSLLPLQAASWSHFMFLSSSGWRGLMAKKFQFPSYISFSSLC